MPAGNRLLTAAGLRQVTIDGRRRISGAACDQCCKDPNYVQAVKCSDRTTVDKWFQCDGIFDGAQAIMTDFGIKTPPFYFTDNPAGVETYVLPFDANMTTTPGTLATNYLEATKCPAPTGCDACEQGTTQSTVSLRKCQPGTAGIYYKLTFSGVTTSNSCVAWAFTDDPNEGTSAKATGSLSGAYLVSYLPSGTVCFQRARTDIVTVASAGSIAQPYGGGDITVQGYGDAGCTVTAGAAPHPDIVLNINLPPGGSAKFTGTVSIFVIRGYYILFHGVGTIPETGWDCLDFEMVNRLPAVGSQFTVGPIEEWSLANKYTVMGVGGRVRVERLCELEDDCAVDCTDCCTGYSIDVGGTTWDGSYDQDGDTCNWENIDTSKPLSRMYCQNGYWLMHIDASEYPAFAGDWRASIDDFPDCPPTVYTDWEQTSGANPLTDLLATGCPP